jgi:hypothetical protein
MKKIQIKKKKIIKSKILRKEENLISIEIKIIKLRLKTLTVIKIKAFLLTEKSNNKSKLKRILKKGTKCHTL